MSSTLVFVRVTIQCTQSHTLCVEKGDALQVKAMRCDGVVGMSPTTT